MRVLVIGSGAREHALCVALQSDPAVTALACAPGNAGTARLAEARPLDVADPVAVAALAVEWAADLVVVGPEVPLVAGAADAVRDAGIACFGPSQQAAQIEGSKAFAKHVMTAAGVPTAQAWPVGGPAELATALDESAQVGGGAPYVVKDDGLAAGKGVLVTVDRAAALAHGRAVLDAGHAVLVEEHLDGPEVSLFALSDGTTVVPLLPAQDSKRRDDGDGGPNTGGMGAYAPLPWAPAGLVDEVLATVLQPTVDEMARRGEPFVGLLYAGLALTSRGVRVVEFNARFGDPETEVVLPLLETPLAGLLHAAANGTLADQPPLRWRDGAAVTVVVAAPGYPERPRTGDPVTGADGEGVLHAGTVVGPDGAVRSSGGRVLAVTAVGTDLAAARQAAYERVAGVRLADAQWRTDIALAAVEGRITLPTAEVAARSDALVVDYDERWARDFRLIRDRLWPVVAGSAVAVEHVGSTAVPGLAAKPVIDVDVVVADPDRVGPVVTALASIGHAHRGDLGIPGREAFSSAPGLPPHHLYVVVLGSAPYRDHVDLRDHLRAHPGSAARYAAEKRRLAPLLATDREAYVRGKAWLVAELLAAARAGRPPVTPP